MKVRAQGVTPRGPGGSGGAELATRLRERREEIEEAALIRAYGVADPGEATDPEYLQGLRSAVAAAVEYGLDSLEDASPRQHPIPAVLLVQARVAARNRIPLDTVLRRYTAGHSLFADFLIGEAEGGQDVSSGELRHLLANNAARLDHLLAAISSEYGREAESRTKRLRSSQRLERIKGLLAGEQIDLAELNYDLEGFHLGLIGSGPDVTDIVRELATRFDRCALSVRCDPETTWGWLGAREGVRAEDLQSMLDHAGTLVSPNDILVFGEPAEGARGWRLTHSQATAILPVVQKAGLSVARYTELALLATILRDDVMARSLRELYLKPLQKGLSGEEVMRETLQAFFQAGGRISSAAALLGVTRRTVSNRLRSVEARLGIDIDRVAVELQIALDLADLDDMAAGRTVPGSAGAGRSLRSRPSKPFPD